MGFSVRVCAYEMLAHILGSCDYHIIYGITLCDYRKEEGPIEISTTFYNLLYKEIF